MVADHDGALFWPEEGVLAVADLHLEKGLAFAQRGVLLPRYDTAATLAQLDRVIARYAPRTVIALGDSFHDDGGPARLIDQDRTAVIGRRVLRSYQCRLRPSVTTPSCTMSFPEKSSGSPSPRFSFHRRRRAASSVPMMILASEPPIKFLRLTL